MPTVSNAARIAGNPRPGPHRKTHRRTVMRLAGPGVRAARDVYTTVPADAVRVAALVEIAAAAAALARTVVKLRHLDPDLIAPHVADRVDLRAVLGRGRWLPTMTRHVPAPESGPVDLAALMPARPPVRRRVVRRRPGSPGQASLFASVVGEG
ncbi:hypothetical protein FHX75_121324 [Micromonospora palomenae]|uniref:Uncharacterized protein n=1 Tax=Micromonospora palomenae TaxID=1461247 RepID=A0A561WG21_9ACTN|nr:hypothetical protein [Micromonospora palomenae]TWG22788.1 hypothetical protein FHX75_121324 [Micromonospora palomenae]